MTGGPAWRRWPNAGSERQTTSSVIARRTTQAARTRFQDVFNMEALPLWANLQSPGPKHLAHALKLCINLSPELRQCVAHRSAGNLDHSVERPIQLQDQEDRAGNRQGADKQRDERGRVWRRKHTKTRQNERDPGNHECEERRRNRAAL